MLCADTQATSTEFGDLTVTISALGAAGMSKEISRLGERKNEKPFDHFM